MGRGRPPGGSGKRSPLSDHRLVESTDEFSRIVDAHRSEPRYALDTEFHRERTYYPRLALLQLAWPDEVIVVDPLECDLAPLRGLLESDATAVLHASDQDLEVLQVACGAIPGRLFDTQVGAGFLGMASISLAALHEQVLGLHLPKGDRLTDWFRRPLEQSQLDYAASDVAHLLEVERIERERLDALGRRVWAEDESEMLRVRPRGERPPEAAWTRIKEARQLRGAAAATAQAVAAWRERRARDTDQPPRFVLSDLAVVGIAQRRPTDREDLRRIRGVDDRHLRGRAGDELLEAIRSAGSRPDKAGGEPPPRELSRELRAATSLISAWVSQLARTLQLDTALLATRADIEALLRGDDTRLRHGWRAETLGEPLQRLLDGDAAVAFVPGEGLVLEARSRRALE